MDYFELIKSVDTLIDWTERKIEHIEKTMPYYDANFQPVAQMLRSSLEEYREARSVLFKIKSDAIDKLNS